MNKHEKAGKALIFAIETRLNKLNYNASKTFYKRYREVMDHNQWDAKLVAGLTEVAAMLHENQWSDESLPVKGPMSASKWFH